MVTQGDKNRIERLEDKLDELIRLSIARDSKIKELSDEVKKMPPTVATVADAVTFARVGRSVFRVMIGIGAFISAVIWWFWDKWAIIGQLFKKAG